MELSPTRRTRSAAPSIAFARSTLRSGVAHQTSRSGATIRSPMASPVHQRSHSEPYAEPGTSPEIQSVVTPFVALTAVLTAAASTTRARTSRTRSRAGLKWTRRSSAAPTTASSVLPTEIADVSGIEASLVAFAMNAPSAIAGQR